MELVSNLADVKAGDVVVDVGRRRYLSRRVRDWHGRDQSERGSGLYRTITVRPAVDFSSLEEVLVVLVPARRRRAEAEPPAARAREVKTAGRHRRARRGAGAADDAGRASRSAAPPRSTWCSSSSSTSRWRSGRWPGCWPARPAGWSRTRWRAASSASAGWRRRSSGSWSACSARSSSSSQPLPRLVMFVGGDGRARGCVQGLYALVESRAFPAAVVGDADPGAGQRAWSACWRSRSSSAARGCCSGARAAALAATVDGYGRTAVLSR